MSVLPELGKARVDLKVPSLTQLKHSNAVTVHGEGSAARKGWLNCVAIENRRSTIHKEIRAARVFIRTALIFADHLLKLPYSSPAP